MAGLDLGTTQLFLEADAPRVRCAEQGVPVAALPWARGGSRFAVGFEDMCAWLVCHITLFDVGDLAADYLAVGVGGRGPGRRGWAAELIGMRSLGCVGTAQRG